MIGKKVKTNCLIQSDDRARGIDDCSELIPSGSIGVIYAKSSDFLPDDSNHEDHEENMFLVEFELPNGRKQTFDLLPEEFTVIDE